MTYDGCAKVSLKPKRHVYKREFLLSRGFTAQQLDLDVANQLRSFGLLTLCRLRRMRERRHVVSLGYRGCRSGWRRRHSTPLVRSVGNGSTDIFGSTHRLVVPPAERHQRHLAGEIPVIIGNRRHTRQLVETLRERTLRKIDRAVDKRSFRVGAPNDKSDETVAEVAA